MRVAVSASRAAWTAPVAPGFGSSAVFVLIDTETGELHAVSNEKGADATEVAGERAAAVVCRMNAQAVITGLPGPEALAMMRAAGVRVLTTSDCTVGEAVARMAAGELAEACELVLAPRGV